MSKSTMVWARKYQLLIPSSRQKGVYSTDENSKKLISEKLVLRSYVEDRNEHMNNELYEIDEKKTAELMKQREQSIIDQAEQKKLENVGMHDLIRAIGNNQQPAPVEKVVAVSEKLPEVAKEDENGLESKSLLELQQICTDKKIQYHHKAKESTLIELIKNA